jgi:hypothetical protein
MALTWVNQNRVPSRTSRSLERTRYLRFLEKILLPVIQSYFSSEGNEKTYVTLVCLEAIGEEEVRRIAALNRRSFKTVKQDIGLFIPILLCEIYGADRIQTYRDSGSSRPGSRTRTKDWSTLTWVNRYTPHKLI